ncbi:hypothetical protein [Muricoccus radiodurans]|uniref:hypothetical protein n=1 Tax=Muricoccus radiodurans TaxID=2231721 RepID=UPI003CECDE79
MLLSDGVRQQGLSRVEAPRIQAQIDTMAGAFHLNATKPSVAAAYTAEFLLPAAARML